MCSCARGESAQAFAASLSRTRVWPWSSTIYCISRARSPVRSFDSPSYRDALFSSSLSDDFPVQIAVLRSQVQEATVEGSFGPSRSLRHRSSSITKHQSTPAMLVQCSHVSIGLTRDLLEGVKGHVCPDEFCPVTPAPVPRRPWPAKCPGLGPHLHSPTSNLLLQP